MPSGKSGPIEGVMIFPKKVIPDSRGRILHGMRMDDPEWGEMAVREVYCSLVYPNAVKAWHLHQEMTLNYFVPVGNIKLVLYDPRPSSSTQDDLAEIYLGENCPHQLVRVPPGIWNGFMVVDNQTALVINIANLEHRREEIQRMDIYSFADRIHPYDWYESFRG